MRTFAAAALGLSISIVAACATSSRSDDDLAGQSQSNDANAEAQDAQRAADYLQEERSDFSLKEQKKLFLVDNYLATARSLMSEMRFKDAELNVAKALELAPDNLDAQRLLDEVGVLLGRDGAGLLTGAEILAQTHQLKRDLARADARDFLDRAKLKQARGDYTGAIGELILCIDVITLNAFSAGLQEEEAEARSLLAQLEAERDTAEAEKQSTARKSARAELQRAEQESRERLENVVQHLTSETIDAFKTARYDDAIEYADRVLRLDPRNRIALDVRDTAFRKQRSLLRDAFLVEKREQYTRWQEGLDELRIPRTETITLPDEDFWREITAIRGKRKGLALDDTADAGEVELRARLKRTTVPGLKITDEESLTAVIEAVRVITGLPLVVDPLAEDAALNEGVVFDFELTNPLSAEKVLNLITQMGGPEVTWTIRHEAVFLTTPEKARGNLIIRNHDVQDLTFGLTDFLGPRIGRLRLLDELEDEDGGSPFGGIAEAPKINDPTELDTLVRENVAVGTWDDDGINLSVQAGYMVVVHSPEVQRQVVKFLDELRRFSSSLVTIESKFLVVRDGFIQEIGVDFRGIDNNGSPFTDLDDISLGNSPTQGLDNSGDGVTLTPPSAGAFLDDGQDGSFAGRTENFFGDALGSALTTVGGLTAQLNFIDDLELNAILRLVEKSENAELINDQIVSVHNTQRAYVTVVNQRAYVQDFDVEVAQFQAIADPAVNVLTEGIVLDVRPTIHHSRKYLTLEVQPTVAQVVSLTNFSTTLAGQTAAVTFQLPEIEVQSIFTTVHIADGSSVLIGGLSRMRNIERRAEVPWISHIPIIGFFFKEEGYNDERESLLISIRAWITDVKEELARLER